jgi:hypothetical protein
MTAKPRKPLLVNLTWTVVLGVVCIAFYAIGAGGIAYAEGRQFISVRTSTILLAPATWFGRSRLPFSRPLKRYVNWAYRAGRDAAGIR